MAATFWGEFRDSLVAHYGSREALETGWVSNTLFEPHVAQEIFTKITGKEKNLVVLRNTPFHEIAQKGKYWNLKVEGKNFRSKIVIPSPAPPR